MIKKAIFIDRDNTLIKDDKGYFHDADKIEFIEGAPEALRRLSRKGFLVFVITNQSGVGRGMFTLKDMNSVHKQMIALLNKKGVKITDIYYCPHHPDDHCACRKPKPYLIYKAAREHNIDISKSFFIGNDINDMEAGKNAGLKTVAVFIRHSQPFTNLIDFEARSFKEAGSWILSQTDIARDSKSKNK